MTEHLVKRDLILLQGGGLGAGELLAAVRHLESCSACAATAADLIDASAAAELWSSTLRSTARDHLRGDQLADYADGRLSPTVMSDASAHLQLCAVCRDDVADLRRWSGRRSRIRQRAALSAAALLLVVAGAGLLGRRASTRSTIEPSRPPAVTVLKTPSPAAVLPAEWRSLVAAAVDRGRIAPPAILATLRVPGDTMRGEGRRETSVVAPDGLVIDDPRPELRWSGSSGAVYIVSIFAGDREVDRSAPLRSASWTPQRDLERGQTYRWQVEARRGNETWIIPPAPQPAPLFALLDEAGHRDLDAARRRYPDDHLLLGVLAARYGLQREAIEELTLGRAAHPDSRVAALLASVRAWRNGDG
jgi:hypothetical protein